MQILLTCEHYGHRKEVPLDDNAAIGIAKCFSVPDLIRNVARARKRAVGGMFPINLN